MTGFLSGESVNNGTSDSSACESSTAAKKAEETGRWYMSRKEIEDYAPSRRDGIGLKKETYLRRSYCTFLQDLGMRLKVPQVTIATAIVFCHRFFLQQSHAKNDRRIIATVCMFLAGKVEETPRPLKDVIIVSYEIIYKKDPAAAQRIKQKEVYEQQKELILLSERSVLATLGFDLNVQHPYKPLVEAIKKFDVAKSALAQVAWNFVNDGLRTSLCLQFKPHHIAAGAIFLAAKFLKVKLPSDGEKVWWQEFDVTPRQLEEVSNQMLELYEQNKAPPSQGSEVEGNVGGGTRAAAKEPAVSEEQISEQIPSCSAPQNSSTREVPPTSTENQSNDGSAEIGSVITDHKLDVEIRDPHLSDGLPQNDNDGELADGSNMGTQQIGAGDQDRIGQNLKHRKGPVGQSPKEAIKMIDKDKFKAALEKRRKARGEITLKRDDLMDEDEFIERELEDGLELGVEDEKSKWEGRQYGSECDIADWRRKHKETEDGKHKTVKLESCKEVKPEEEITDGSSTLMKKLKRKPRHSPDGQPEDKKWLDGSYYNEHVEDGGVPFAEGSCRRPEEESHC
ncbi:cyclin-T1-3-like [Neltuma alba]|uniref:cyclin-T1-3-like n=1 Tax=Neltuma alba TaxID=207710 RepID=UPI0010A3598D|nr:cyclin-T1-3-like [Prosopis alba]XP_028759350.1 cyclin-T1-3-like [Prosopis alba]